MAVEFVPLPITLKGISQKSPSNLSVPGELVAADNVQILKGGPTGVELSKRYGTRPLSQETDSVSGITAASPKHLATLADTLVMDNDQAVFVRQPSVDKWLTRSKQGLNWASKSENVSQSNYQKTFPCHAYDAASGNEIIAWYDEQDGVRYSVRARAYGTWVVHEVRVKFILTSVSWAQALKVQVFAPGDGNFYLLYPRTSGATLGIARINCVTPGLPVEVGSLALDATACPFDAQQTPEGKLLIAAKTVGAATVTVQQWDPLTATSSNLNTTAVAVSGAPTCLSWMSQDPWPAIGSRNYWIATVDSFQAKAWQLSDTLTAVNNFLIEATTLTNVVGYVSSNLPKVMTESISFNYGHGSYIKFNGTLYQRSALVASKPFAYNGVWYCIIRFDSVLQPTLFLYDIVNKRPVGKVGLVGAQWSNTYFTFGYQPWVTQIGSLAIVAAQAAHEGLGQTAAVPVGVQIQGAAIVTFDGAPATSKPAELGNVLHYAGSIPWIFDGAVCTESGFNLFPEWGPVSPFSDSGSGFSKTVGAVYSYRATYTWSDAAGNAYESAPSQILSYTATTTDHINVAVPTYCLTTRTDVSINLYRNDPKQPEVFRLVNSASVPNDVTNDTVTILDDLFDLANGTDWATRAMLYAGDSLPFESGGSPPLEHLPPPSCTLMATAQSRVFAAGIDQDPTAVWVSNEVVLGEGVSYHDSLRFRVGTPPTAVVGRDRNIVVFTEDNIWTVTGEFPDATGGSFALPTSFKLPHPVGAINPNAIVVTSLGIFFQSKKGLYILDWNWSATYIGGGIEDTLGSQLITAGLEVPSLHQVRLYTASGTTLVWDTLFSQWTTFSGQAAYSACNWLDVPMFVDGTGRGSVETPGIYGDNGVFVKSSVTLAIVSPAGLRGYHSLKAMQLVGEVRGPHQLNASLTYDGKAAPVSAYNAINEALPGSDDALKWEIRPKKRQCSAWQLTLSDAQLTAGTTQGFALQAIVASVGIEGGLDRLAASQRMRGA